MLSKTRLRKLYSEGRLLCRLGARIRTYIKYVYGSARHTSSHSSLQSEFSVGESEGRLLCRLGARILLNQSCERGFSLIEALISTAIICIGLTGVFGMTAFSENFMQRSIAKQKMQMIADQIIAVVESDIDNIDSYNLGLESCATPASAEKYDVRSYEWCVRLRDEVGADSANTTRNISVTTLADGRKVLHILLESHESDAQIAMKRVFDVE